MATGNFLPYFTQLFVFVNCNHLPEAIGRDIRELFLEVGIFECLDENY